MLKKIKEILNKCTELHTEKFGEISVQFADFNADIATIKLREYFLSLLPEVDEKGLITGEAMVKVLEDNGFEFGKNTTEEQKVEILMGGYYPFIAKAQLDACKEKMVEITSIQAYTLLEVLDRYLDANYTHPNKDTDIHKLLKPIAEGKK